MYRSSQMSLAEVSSLMIFEGCHCHAGNLFQIDPTPKLYSFAGCSCSNAQEYTATTYVDAQGAPFMTWLLGPGAGSCRSWVLSPVLMNWVVKPVSESYATR